MAQQRRSGGGCFIIAAILGVVAIGAVVLGVILLAKVRVTETHDVAVAEARHMSEVIGMAAADQGDRVVFADDGGPTMAVPKPGEELTLEQFAAYKLDESATELARESFQKATDQAEVRWKLKLREISNRDGKLYGQFTLPWTVRSDHGSSSSSLTFNVWFEETQRESLLSLRVGDWVTVGGRLSYKDAHPSLMDAVLADAPVAEKP